MSKVYVYAVAEDTKCTPSETEEIYSTEERAQEAADKLTRKYTGTYIVRKYEVKE